MGRRNGKQRARVRPGEKCCFCGGKVPSETIEHAPPICLFRNNQRPKGYEFPACKRCNIGSSQMDQIAAFFALCQGDVFQDGYETRTHELLRGISNNCPDALWYLDQFRTDHKIRLQLDGETLESNELTVGRGFRTKFLNPWAAKQACALWFQHTQRPIVECQRIWTAWLPYEAMSDADFIASTQRLLTNGFELKQGKKSFGDQYSYIWQLNGDMLSGGFLITLHKAVAVLICIGSEETARQNSSKISFGELFKTAPRHGIERCLPM